jgi:Membrane-fusion protein
VQINKHEGLLPGMNVDVSIVVGQVNQVMSVPVTAVERGDRVLVKTEDGTTGEGAPEGLKYVNVITGMSDEDYVEIISGLKPGDTVAYIPAESRGTDLLMMMSNGNRPMVAGGGN